MPKSGNYTDLMTVNDDDRKGLLYGSLISAILGAGAAAMSGGKWKESILRGIQAGSTGYMTGEDSMMKYKQQIAQAARLDENTRMRQERENRLRQQQEERERRAKDKMEAEQRKLDMTVEQNRKDAEAFNKMTQSAIGMQVPQEDLATSPSVAKFQAEQAFSSMKPDNPETSEKTYEAMLIGMANRGEISRSELEEKLVKYRKATKGGINVNIGKPAPVGLIENLDKLYDLTNKLDNIEKNFDKSFVGMVDAKVGTAKEYTGLGVTEKEVGFRQMVNDVNDELLRLRSGAAISEQEYQRLSRFVPVLNLSEDAFMARLKALKSGIDSAIRVRQSSISQSGYKGIKNISAPSTAEEYLNSINIEIDGEE